MSKWTTWYNEMCWREDQNQKGRVHVCLHLLVYASVTCRRLCDYEGPSYYQHSSHYTYLLFITMYKDKLKSVYMH